jgi:DNA-binding transcriptional LysR family regulator
MLNGQIDYLLLFSQFQLPQEIYQHRLKEIKLSLIARKDHPVLSKSTALEDIHHLPITRILADGINSKRAPVEDFYLARGYTANIVLTTHSIRVLLNKLKHSDALSFGSTLVTENEPELSCYPLPTVPKEMRSIQINGGYLQSKRVFPLNQLLHQTIQNFFDKVIQPEK